MVGHRPLSVFVLSAFICAGASRAGAATIVLDAVDQGWYREDGLHLVLNPNYIAGVSSDLEFRNFFVFDLSGLTSIESAALRLNTEEYESPDATETYTVFDVITPIASLVNGTGGVAAFDDLGSGTSYGTRVYSEADEFQVRNIALNAAALIALNLGIGQLFALGGSLTSLNGAPFEFVFGFSGNQTARLVIETDTDVPEPSTLLLLSTGVALGLSRRLRRRAL